MVARMASALAWPCFHAASAESRSDCDTVSMARSLRARSRLTRAHSICASAARNCASSREVSRRTSRSPFATTPPDSKAISFTVPANSVVTLIP